MVRKIGIWFSPVVSCPRGDKMPLKYCRVGCPFFKGFDEQDHEGGTIRCAWGEKNARV